jgi:hypothetical protein
MVQEMLIIQVELVDVIIQVHLHQQLGIAFLVQLEQGLQLMLFQQINVVHKLLVGIMEFIHLQLVVQLQAPFVSILRLFLLAYGQIQYQ